MHTRHDIAHLHSELLRLRGLVANYQKSLKRMRAGAGKNVLRAALRQTRQRVRATEHLIRQAQRGRSGVAQ